MPVRCFRLAFSGFRASMPAIMSTPPADYEKLGQFYLGREYDPETKQADDELVLYDSKDLVTHGVVLGMTGSGKTGLCLALLEEAAMDNIPAIVIDPKGDISNLLLTFPDLDGEEFPPVDQRGRRREKRRSLPTNTRRKPPPCGRAASPSGGRRRSASASSATRWTSTSSPPAARRASRFPSSARWRCRRSRSWTTASC